IEAWAMADACFTAYQVTSAERWRRDALRACQWFLGLNDSGIVMYDSEVGAGFDGLSAHAANQNRGAESTLAALGAMIRMRQLAPGPAGS
ncbi:MAG: glycosyltransferase, partial [Actinomycetota bacterium]